MWLSFYSCTYRQGILASLAFPYTLDTGETITEGMGMECLTGDHTPKTDPRHNLVVTAPPYKTRGSTTIGRGGQFPYSTNTQQGHVRFLHSPVLLSVVIASS